MWWWSSLCKTVLVIVVSVCDGKEIHIHYFCEQTVLCWMFVVWFAACPHYSWILIMRKKYLTDTFFIQLLLDTKSLRLNTWHYSLFLLSELSKTRNPPCIHSVRARGQLQIRLLALVKKGVTLAIWAAGLQNHDVHNFFIVCSVLKSH